MMMNLNFKTLIYSEEKIDNLEEYIKNVKAYASTFTENPDIYIQHKSDEDINVEGIKKNKVELDKEKLLETYEMIVVVGKTFFDDFYGTDNESLAHLIYATEEDGSIMFYSFTIEDELQEKEIMSLPEVIEDLENKLAELESLGKGIKNNEKLEIASTIKTLKKYYYVED